MVKTKPVRATIAKMRASYESKPMSRREDECIHFMIVMFIPKMMGKPFKKTFDEFFDICKEENKVKELAEAMLRFNISSNKFIARVTIPNGEYRKFDISVPDSEMTYLPEIYGYVKRLALISSKISNGCSYNVAIYNDDNMLMHSVDGEY